MPTDNEGVNIVITGDGSQAINEISRVNKSLSAMLSFEVGSKLEASFGSLFKGILAGVQRLAGTLSGVMKNSLALGGGFESQMTAVQVISGATGDELAELTKKAREMGANLPISAKDAATAMTLLAQRGTQAKDILASVADVANLTISQGVNMGAAADLLGSTITNFGLKIEDAAKVTAIFNNASNQSALTIHKMIEALKYVGPAAGAVGMELTEAMSAMEALANAGLTGEMTGTGLAMVLTKLSQKTRIMGVETKTLDGKMRPLADIFSELQARGFSLAEATAEFGARGRLAAINLAKQSESLRENEERLKNWGSTQAAVDAKSKTFTNTMAAFRSAMEELHIEIFDQIKDKSKGVTSNITELVRAFSSWIGKTQIAGKSLQAFLEGLGFKIPAADDFKSLLEKINVQAFVNRLKGFAESLRGIADSVVSFFNNVKTPLLFLIEHLDSFMTLSFWGWITGKALQIPAIIMSLGSAFKYLADAVKTLVAANLAKAVTFLNAVNPYALAAGIVAVAGGVSMWASMAERAEAEKSIMASMAEEKRYLQEQTSANKSLLPDIDLNIKTGFEKLPESWVKASDELRAKANETVKSLQEAFKGKVGAAIQAVMDKFPEMAQALDDVSENMTYSVFSNITKALQGNKDAFDALSDPMKAVVEQLASMGIQAGQTSGNVNELISAWKNLQQEVAADEAIKASPFETFAQELNNSVASIADSLPDTIEHLQKFMSGNNLDLVVNLSIQQAESQVKQLSKSIGEKFNVPADIVSSELLVRLQSLADKGNTAAQSIVNGWNDANNSLDTFLANAKDAVTYLGEAPEKFTPALNNLASSIQKFDPLTGKVTDKFKKAQEALRQWANVTFDQLSQRIQRLRKAVEGGFVDKKVLEEQFKVASQQIKLQVVAELEPSRSQYSKEGFASVVASEYMTRMGELGGEAFMDMLRKEWEGLYDKSGYAIGTAILAQVKKGFDPNSTVLKIDGVNVGNQGGLDFSSLLNVVPEAVQPFVAKLEQLGAQQDSARANSDSYVQNASNALLTLNSTLENNSAFISKANDNLQTLGNSISALNTSSSASTFTGGKDYSADLSNIVKELVNISSGITNLSQTSTVGFNGVTSAVNAVENAIRANQQGESSVSFDAASIAQAVITGINPFVNRFDAATSAYQASASEFSKGINNLDSSFSTLRQAADSNTSAINSLQSAMASGNSSGSNESFAGALSPLVNSVQNLAATVGTIQSVNQGNAAAIREITNAVKAVENAVKALDAGNTYNIDIKQEGFSVQKKSDADSLARSTASALRVGLGNGGV